VNQPRNIVAAAAGGLGCIFVLCLTPSTSRAWGDEGHKVVALVADHYLHPGVRQKVQTILATDTSQLTPSTDIADEATWADKFRDSDRHTTKVRYNLTHQWHFVDIEITGGDIDTACFGHPAQDTKASQGPAQDCVVDKINAFASELRDPNTDADERRAALQFLLHFIGDVHQPLHASDDHDQGGNLKSVEAVGIATGTLHHYWDTEFVARLGTDPKKVAQDLVDTTSPGQVKSWSKGGVRSWAVQSSNLARLRAYGGLGDPDANGKYTLSSSYVTHATNAIARQLARAGVRLARVLNDALQ